MSFSRPLSPSDILPSPGHIERKTSFMWRWIHSPRAKKVFHGKVMQEGMKAWEAAKQRSVVSVKTVEDEFLVFDDGQ